MAKTWEETVMSDTGIGDLLDLEMEYRYPCSDGSETITIDCRQVAKAQAKLTWDIAEKAGIKKVVDWMPELIQQIKNCMWSDEWGVKGVIYENILDPLVERQLQAFLKKCEK